MDRSSQKIQPGTPISSSVTKENRFSTEGSHCLSFTVAEERTRVTNDFKTSCADHFPVSDGHSSRLASGGKKKSDKQLNKPVLANHCQAELFELENTSTSASESQNSDRYVNLY